MFLVGKYEREKNKFDGIRILYDMVGAEVPVKFTDSIRHISGQTTTLAYPEVQS